ncbi:hypothetical protein B0H11DRAFT_1686485, partial [Mycena galericulata]
LARRVRNQQRAVYYIVLDGMKKRFRIGGANESYMEEVLARREEFGMDEGMIALVEGASATISTYLHSFVLSLGAYPDAQKKAYEEIDRVVDAHHMPAL